MIILIGLALLTVVGIIIWYKADYWFSNWELVGMLTTVVAGGSLLIALILLPLNYYSGKAEVERYHVLKETIEISRTSEDVSDVERAALTTEISQYNKDLASVKYWNDTIFDIYIYDGLAELDYLE